MDEQQEVLKKYSDGIPVRSIAADHGVSRETVNVLARLAGAPVRFKGLEQEQVRHAAERYEAGDSLATIGRQLKVDPSTVRSYLLAAGATMRPQRGGRRAKDVVNN